MFLACWHINVYIFPLMLLLVVQCGQLMPMCSHDAQRPCSYLALTCVSGDPITSGQL